jgi:hypothetical protein
MAGTSSNHHTGDSLMEKQLSDESLVASGKRSAYKTDCTSVLVATGVAPIRPPDRNYFLCDMGTKTHDTHHNGRDSWWIDEGTGNWVFEGDTLTDVSFVGAN